MLIMLAEDDTLHRSFLRATLERTMQRECSIYETGDGNDAITMAKERRPDCIVMDLQMPKVSGAEAAKAIWRNRPDTRILFWSNFADEAYVRGIAKIVPPDAVYGYILKSASEERLSVAIRGVFIEDQCVIDREVRGVQQRTESRSEGLTNREYEILIDVALGLTDRAIAARHGLSTRGAQCNIQQLYEKLGVSDVESGSGHVFNFRTRALFVALSRGLINPDALVREDIRLKDWPGLGKESGGR